MAGGVLMLYPISGYVHFGYGRQWFRICVDPPERNVSSPIWAAFFSGVTLADIFVIELGASFD